MPSSEKVSAGGGSIRMHLLPKSRLDLTVGKDHVGTPDSTRNESIGIHIRFAPESASMGNSMRTRLFR